MDKISKGGIYWVVLLIIVGGIGGFFYFKKTTTTSDEQRTMNNDQLTTINSDLPEGVEVVEEGGENIIRDFKNNYQLIAENIKIIKADKNRRYFYEQENQYLPSFTVEVVKNIEESDMDTWLLKFHEENWLMYYDEREKISVNSVIGYKIKQEGDPETYSYYFLNENNIYLITTPESSDYNEVVNTFEIIK